MKLAGLGKQVVLIEQSPVMYGGTCINIACVPTKKLITEAVRRGDAEPNEYFTQAVERRDGLIGKLNDKNFHMVADLDNTTVIDGRATFVGDKQIQVETADGTVEVTADTVIIGTGATPRRLDIQGSTGRACTTRPRSSTRRNSRNTWSSLAPARSALSSPRCSLPSVRRSRS